MKIKRKKIFRRICDKLDCTNILDGFNYNANLDIGIQIINKNIKNKQYQYKILPTFILDDGKYDSRYRIIFSLFPFSVKFYRRYTVRI